ncbi:EamA-like transporter family protein, partial [Striga asiatica]
MAQYFCPIKFQHLCWQFLPLPKSQISRLYWRSPLQVKVWAEKPGPCSSTLRNSRNDLVFELPGFDQQGNDSKCTRQKSLLSTCMDAQSSGKRKPWGSINYHLQRLSRGRNVIQGHVFEFIE